ncbi:MAG: hypothetical protein D6715_05270 [Calditrichaeota bacterium]|nr:MAG: hypothetical protein D6715_05270 [Calditrichota bacterium]
MADVGLNQNVTIGGRQFHIQTATHVEEGIVRSEVFEKGRLLFVEAYPYERRDYKQERGAEFRLRKLVDQYHQSIIEEIDAIFEVSQALEEEDNVIAHEKMGLVFMYMYLFDRAKKHFRRAIGLDPNRYSSVLYLAKTYFMEKRYAQAEDVVARLLARKVRYPDLLNLAGMLALETGEIKKSLSYFKQAIAGNPSYVEAYLNLALALLRRIVQLRAGASEAELHKHFKFLLVLLRKIESIGRVRERRLAGKLIQLVGKGNIKQAAGLLNEYRDKVYLRRVPPEIEGHKFYLRLRYSGHEMSPGTLANYEQSIRQAINENPSYPDLWNYLALVHLMQSRLFFLTGLDDFREATRINPAFEKAKKNLRLVENDGREFLSLIKTVL